MKNLAACGSYATFGPYCRNRFRTSKQDYTEAMSDHITLIKKLAVIAMFSDDDLFDLLVLKGGNAIDLIHNLALRSSKDIDLSIEDEFKEDSLNLIKSKIEISLKKTFNEEGFEVFDITFKEKPPELSQDMKEFWGGYTVEFKVIESTKFDRFKNDVAALRRNSTVTGPKNKKIFSIDISKHEFCTNKQEYDLNGYTIYVYSPEMIVFEKLRAICQQMPEYRQIVKQPSQSARAKDFFDIFIISEKFEIQFATNDNIQLLPRFCME